MIGRGLSGRYIKPLFDIACERKQLEKIASDLEQFHSALQDSSELRSCLNNPSISRKAKRSIIEELLADSSPYTLNFIKVLIDKNRTHVLDIAFPLFKELIDAAKGVTTGIVESAVEMDDDMFVEISKLVERSFDRKVDLERRVSPDIIGGLRIQVGNTVLDASVKGRLLRLKETIAGDY